MYYLTEADRRTIADTILQVMDERHSRLERDTQATTMAPEVYFVKGTVPARQELPDGALIAGKCRLPVYRLFPYDPYHEPGDDIRWEIVPVLLEDGTHKHLEIFNVRDCSPDNDYNIVWRDKFGRWHIDFFCCREEPPLYSVWSSSSSSSSSSVGSGLPAKCNIVRETISIFDLPCMTKTSVKHWFETQWDPKWVYWAVSILFSPYYPVHGGNYITPTDNLVAHGDMENGKMQESNYIGQGWEVDPDGGPDAYIINNDTQLNWVVFLYFYCDVPDDPLLLTAWSHSASPGFCSSVGLKKIGKWPPP